MLAGSTLLHSGSVWFCKEKGRAALQGRAFLHWSQVCFWPWVDATQMFMYIDDGQPTVCDFALQWLPLREETPEHIRTCWQQSQTALFFSSALIVFHQLPYLIDLCVNGFSVLRKDFSKMHFSEYFSEGSDSFPVLSLPSLIR